MTNTLKLTADQRLRAALMTFNITATKKDLGPIPARGGLRLVAVPPSGRKVCGPRASIENRPHIQIARNLALRKGKKF